MFFGKIDFPEEVRDAALRGELTIFAGAGVSMGEPANLPSFKELCHLIGLGLAKELQQEPAEPEDEYLGRLVDAGVPVHKRAAMELRSKDPKPTELHHSLVAIFSSPEECHIATTNFDTLFEEAAKKRWTADAIETFSAPALPLGESFSGIVHAHGSLSDLEERMVLSDADFARAYLTEGWARRFLRGVTERFVILFVGFSFQDVPSRYLIRGLPVERKGRLFALIPEDSQARVPRNVTAIPFDPGEAFVELRVGLREFAIFVDSDAAQHRDRIAQLVTGLPPPVGPQADYMKWALHDTVQAGHLRRDSNFARRDWLVWATERDLLIPLFTAEGELDDASIAMAEWLWNLALQEDTWRECAELLATYHGRINTRVREVLWGVLSRRVTELKQRGFPLGPRESYWLAIANSCGGAWPRPAVLEHLLSELPNGADAIFIDLWTAAGRPELVLSPSIRYPDNESKRAGVRFELGFGADAYAFREAWSRHRERVCQLALLFLPVVRSQIEAAHRLRQMTGETWDPESLVRIEIRDSPQNVGSDQDGMSVLIEAARDSLLALARSDREAFARKFEDWIASPAPLVQRIALLAMANSLTLSPEEVLRRFMVESWLDVQGAKPEGFALLKAAFPTATSDARKQFLDSMMPNLLREDDEPDPSLRREKNETREYEWFNLLVWLDEALPRDAELTQRLDKSRESHAYFEKRGRPDLDHMLGESGYVEAIAPISKEELLMMDASNLVVYAKRIRESPRIESFLVDRFRGLLELVGKTAAVRRDWAFPVATQLLLLEGRIAQELVEAILSGWSDSEIEPAVVSEILEWMGNQRWLRQHVEPASRVVEKVLARGSRDLKDKDLDRAEALVATLWSVAPEFAPAEKVRDWLFEAINHPQGRLGLAVLHLASAWKFRRAEDQDKFPVSLLSLVERMMRADAKVRPLARVVLASQVHFFFAAAEAFTKAEILPWFDWEVKGQNAVQAWDGYLQWGRIYPSLFRELRPQLLQTFTHLQNLGRQRQRLVEFLAHLALFPDSEPVKDNWLTEFFAAASDEDRGHWTATIAGEAERLGTELAGRSWQNWLGAWVAKRLQAGYPVPKPLELSAFYRLTLALPSRKVGDALQLLRNDPAPPENFRYELHRLGERVAELEPDDLLQALVLLLENTTGYLYLPQEAAIAEKLREAKRDDLKQRLRATLVRLQRADLADRLLNPPEPEDKASQ